MTGIPPKPKEVFVLVYDRALSPIEAFAFKRLGSGQVARILGEACYRLDQDDRSDDIHGWKIERDHSIRLGLDSESAVARIRVDVGQFQRLATYFKNAVHDIEYLLAKLVASPGNVADGGTASEADGADPDVMVA